MAPGGRPEPLLLSRRGAAGRRDGWIFGVEPVLPAEARGDEAAPVTTGSARPVA